MSMERRGSFCLTSSFRVELQVMEISVDLHAVSLGLPLMPLARNGPLMTLSSPVSIAIIAQDGANWLEAILRQRFRELNLRANGVSTPDVLWYDGIDSNANARCVYQGRRRFSGDTQVQNLLDQSHRQRDWLIFLCDGERERLDDVAALLETGATLSRIPGLTVVVITHRPAAVMNRMFSPLPVFTPSQAGGAVDAITISNGLLDVTSPWLHQPF